MDDALPPQWRNWALEGKEWVRDLLMGAGLQETISYALVGPEMNRRLLAAQAEPNYDVLAADEDLERRSLPVILDPEVLVRLENPLAGTADRLRSTLLSSMMEILAGNLRHEERVTLFEIGKGYWPRAGQLLPAEPELIAIGLSGPRDWGAWLNRDEQALDFFDLKGVVETLLERLSLLERTRFEAVMHPLFGPRAARILVDGREIGVMGEVHPAVRRAFELPDHRVCLSELRLAPLTSMINRREQMQAIPSYPAVKEDLAVLVDEAVNAEAVEQVIRQAGGSLLRDVRLFDVYRGSSIPAGKKSLAYSLTFQAMDRTLKDADAEKARRRIVARLEQALGAELRA
jgi:phenylalanyl-tRNA synthetase beta chain